MGYDKLIFVIASIVAVAIVVCIIKKVAKLIVFILLAVFAFFIIRGVTSGQSPSTIVNSTKNDVTYTREIYNYTNKIKKSVENTQNAIENKSLPKLKEENQKLHTYLQEVTKLPYEIELKSFHNKYCSYLNNIVISSDAALKVESFTEVGSKKLKEVKSSLNKHLDELMSIQDKK